MGAQLGTDQWVWIKSLCEGNRIEIIE